MSTSYDTYLESAVDFLDFSEQLQVDISETLALLQTQLNKVKELKTTAIEFASTNDMLSTDNMHTLELLNCSAIELTRIASRQKQLLIQRRRTKNLLTWIQTNEDLLKNLQTFSLRYMTQTAPKLSYTYRTQEGFELALTFKDAFSRMTGNVRKPNGSTTFYYKKVRTQALEKRQKSMPASVEVKIKTPVVQETVSKHMLPYLSSLDSIVTPRGTFTRSHSHDMSSLPEGKTETRFLIAKKASAFVLYDYKEKLLLAQSKRIPNIFTYIQDNHLDLKEIGCASFYFPSLAHYIHDSLRGQSVPSVPIDFIKDVAVQSFNLNLSTKGEYQS